MIIAPIRSKRDYERALRRIEGLMDAKPRTKAASPTTGELTNTVICTCAHPAWQVSRSLPFFVDRRHRTGLGKGRCGGGTQL